MRKIILLCAAGMSTSLLVTKMKTAAQAEGYDCEIAAYPITEAKDKALGADAVLLGPQVRHELKKIKTILTGQMVESIDMVAYGMIDGKKVIAQAKKMIGDE